jgi:hypothetical protein
MKIVGAEAGSEGKNSLFSRYWGGLNFSPKVKA